MSILKVPIQINGGTDPFNTSLKERELYIDTSNGMLHWGNNKGVTQNASVWSSSRSDRIGWYDTGNTKNNEFKRYTDDSKNTLATEYLLIVDSVNGRIKSNPTDSVILDGKTYNGFGTTRYIDITPTSCNIGGFNVNNSNINGSILSKARISSDMYGPNLPSSAEQGAIFFKTKS